MYMRVLIFVSMTASTLLLAGCGGERTIPTPKAYPVKGTVSHNGSPVAGVFFTLEPATPGGVPARAATDANGSFELRTFSDENPDGAVPGQYVVVFDTTAKSLPADVNTRKLTVEIKGEDDDLQINIDS